MISSFQNTLRERISLTGVGVHRGTAASITLSPAEPDTGIVFLKSDPESGAECEIPALHTSVVATARSTILGDGGKVAIGTVEHLLAALGGLGVDNAQIEIDGDEVPIMDGSAEAFADAVLQAGIRRQQARRRFIKVLKPVRVALDSSLGELTPFEGRRCEVEIDFPSPVIGRQCYVFDLDRDDFVTDLSRARTFGFLSEVEGMWARGFALGASLDNTLVIGDDAVVNPEGLRYSDEFVRHKALDAIGDLTLAGAPILGHYRSVRGSHRLNCAVVEALMADASAWTFVEMGRRESGHAEVGTMVPAAAFAPDVS